MYFLFRPGIPKLLEQRRWYITAENDNRLDRIERGIEKIQEDVSALRESVGRIEGKLPHLATDREVEEAKHEATKAKYSVLVSVIAVVVAMASLITRLWIS